MRVPYFDLDRKRCHGDYFSEGYGSIIKSMMTRVVVVHKCTIVHIFPRWTKTIYDYEHSERLAITWT